MKSYPVLIEICFRLVASSSLVCQQNVFCMVILYPVIAFISLLGISIELLVLHPSQRFAAILVSVDVASEDVRRKASGL